MKLTLGISPCPNDTFIFDAVVNHKIDTEGIEFETQLEDVQTLNEWALKGLLDISKISYGVLPHLLSQYVLLSAGGALGKGVGPLLICKTEAVTKQFDATAMCIAIPGENTTAHMLFNLAYPTVKQKRFIVFNEIEAAVLNEKVDAGVIIHENRFTYQQKGLHKIIDLGNFWEAQTGAPIPLGGIIMKKKFSVEIQQQINTLIHKSVAYAFAHYPQLSNYVRMHSQEMSEEVMRQHIELYVNDYSYSLQTDGRKAVETLLDVFYKNNTAMPKTTLHIIGE